MQDDRVSVIFISRRNSARSILAQACLCHLGASRFRAFSCGAPLQIESRPHPLALEALANARIPAPELHCIGWDKFARSGGSQMDFVINLADEVADQLPRWPGQPPTALWSYPDIIMGSRSGS